jgi:16S rRNA (cytidine1402-2'-O)-methyltransferase
MSAFTPGLYIASTPIGNLDDITLRALAVLKNSEIILCEDTRRTLKLLNHFSIKKKLIPYHKFNEKKELNQIIRYLNEGKILTLVSDAGTPALSDPGLSLINECILKKIPIFPIPGPSAITTAMSVSGFEDKFLFYGFLPKKDKELERVLLKLQNIDFAIIFFVPSIRLNFYMNKYKLYFAGREILIARELTKLHETFYRGDLSEIDLSKLKLKGELTIVISKKKKKVQLNY